MLHYFCYPYMSIYYHSCQFGATEYDHEPSLRWREGPKALINQNTVIQPMSELCIEHRLFGH